MYLSFPLSNLPISLLLEGHEEFGSRIGSSKYLPCCFPKCVAHSTSYTGKYIGVSENFGLSDQISLKKSG